MYSEGSDFLPQNNETALQYFKKASDLVRLSSFSYVTHFDCSAKSCFSAIYELLYVVYFIPG